MPKHKLTLSIYNKIITQAKKQQINLSSFLEIRLIRDVRGGAEFSIN